MGAGCHSLAAVAVVAGGGSHASWFVGDGEGRLSMGGRRRLWAVDGGRCSFMGSGRRGWWWL